MNIFGSRAPELGKIMKCSGREECIERWWKEYACKLEQCKDERNKYCHTKFLDKNKLEMSMIPFMRGYAHFSLDPDDYYGRLSEVMHGYGTSTIDLIPIYKKLFGVDFGGKELISSTDVLSIDCDKLDFFKTDNYPLLADTLKQTLIYYYLRMNVEKTLMDIFHLKTKPNEILMLNQIIQKAFKPIPNDPNADRKREHRVFFASRKTLLNEFIKIFDSLLLTSIRFAGRAIPNTYIKKSIMS